MADPRVALLIDADNISGSHADAIVGEAARHGRLVIRRMYGDWTRQQLQKWKDVTARHAIQPIQQFSNTPGKNATDSALIIDAMDLLHGNDADVFVIVSSDADFTRLASRLRESARVVVGIGRAATPKAFIGACERFVTLENLGAVGDDSDDEPPPLPARTSSRGGRGSRSRSKAVPEPLAPEPEPIAPTPTPLSDLLAKAYDHAESDDGHAHLGTLGNHLARLDPAFDPRNYGFRQLRKLVAAQPGYSLRELPGGQGLIVERAEN